MINALPSVLQRYHEAVAALMPPGSGYLATVGKTKGLAWLIEPFVWGFIDTRNRYRIVNDWDIVVSFKRITKATLQAHIKREKQPKKPQRKREVTAAVRKARHEAAIAEKMAARAADLGV